jgi:polysaccharide export outer membrane protein
MKNLAFLSVALTIAFTNSIGSNPVLAQTGLGDPSGEVEMRLDSTPAQNQSEAPVDNQTAIPLKPGDQIRITVTGFPDLSNEQTILPDGTVQLPLAGSLKLARLTPLQATTLITDALRPYVRRPQVALALLNVSPLRISVTGEVLKPGPRLLNPTAQQNPQTAGSLTGPLSNSPATVSDAVALAGGITPDADLRNITVYRVVPNNPTFANSATVTRAEIKVDLWKAIQSGDLSGDIRVFDGDQIVVPTAQLSSAAQQSLLNSTIAPNAITVQVAGEVNRPGTITTAPNTRISDAIAAAGGPTDKANRRAIELFRVGPDGRLQHQRFAYSEVSTPLRTGDLIIVRKNGLSGVVDTLNQIAAPIGSLLFPFINLVR